MPPPTLNYEEPAILLIPQPIQISFLNEKS